jgi:hypothetical protein
LHDRSRAVQDTQQQQQQQQQHSPQKEHSEPLSPVWSQEHQQQQQQMEQELGSPPQHAEFDTQFEFCKIMAGWANGQGAAAADIKLLCDLIHHPRFTVAEVGCKLCICAIFDLAEP